jgi:hypothetical protein
VSFALQGGRVKLYGELGKAWESFGFLDFGLYVDMTWYGHRLE